ncbi:hypothetical protein KO529_13995 [Arenibacter algicola]|uniref:BfmA/BtgA family mobilization protein n=1 Tax=Arenibacter algicola TaxID=616991 RepID=UPI001C06FF2D|nr:BfmA/BtgA family mobilization protein [Arenibacter algicola]MBU2905906.1 hypothetical protein [Arenibacter algicola]
MEPLHNKTYHFSAISIKTGIAARFRKFSKKVGRSHSEALESMMNFFEWNDISPNASLGPNMTSMENRLKKRINALVAIIKNIEKNQTKPTNAMLELLFQEDKGRLNENQEEIIFEAPPLITENEELEYYRKQYDQMREQFQLVKTDLQKLCDAIVFVKGSFGSGYLKLQMTQEEFKNFINSSPYVHHHNKTKNGR